MQTESSFLEMVRGSEPDYNDDGIALLDDVRRLGLENGMIYLNDMALLVIVRAGEMRFDVDSVRHTVTPEHALFCRPGNAIGISEYSQDFSGHAIALSMRLCQKLLAALGNIWGYIAHASSHPVLRLPENGHELLRDYYSLLKKEVVRKENAYYSEVISSLSMALLCSLIDVVMAGERDRMAQEECDSPSQPQALFHRFMRILNNERCTERKIDYYAQRLCVTSKYLSAVCKRVSNRTAHQWIRDTVLNGIRNSLHYGNQSIKEISVTYGFPNVTFFSKYVKKHLGQSPISFREQR